ncbi:MAG: EamA family transporter [Bacteroidota bacterium]
MLYLAGAIIFSSWLIIAFKIAERFGLSTFQAIIFNYFTCVITGILLEGKLPVVTDVVKAPWFMWAVLMGLMFVSVFNLVAYTTRKSGVAIASVANKLSLVIPFLFSVYLYQEKISFLKIAGVLVALLAVFFTCIPSTSSKNDRGFKWNLFLLPLLLFAGSGLIDTLIKYVEFNFIKASNHNIYIITAFSVAGLAGIILFAGLLIRGKERFDVRAIIAGVLIGMPNYFSLWCLVHVLKMYEGNSSAIIPITNMGIVLFSTLVAALFFKERLSKINLIGIILSVIAISIIAFG